MNHNHDTFSNTCNVYIVHYVQYVQCTYYILSIVLPDAIYLGTACTALPRRAAHQRSYVFFDVQHVRHWTLDPQGPGVRVCCVCDVIVRRVAEV